MRLAPLAALVLAAGAALLPSRALAYEDELTVDVGVGYAHAFASGAVPSSGVPLALTASVGLNDVWTLRATATYALHPGDPTVQIGVLGAELLYIVDILEIVPYFGAGVDALASLSHGELGADFAAHLVLGADYLLSRSAYVGVDLRSYLLVSDLFATNPRFPVYLTVLARVGFVFDL